MQIITREHGRQTSNPKTVLAFYAVIVGILESAALGAIWVLAWSHTMTWLIPWILGTAILSFVLVVGAVLVINMVDPSKLMLGQITGHEYAAIHGMRLGDSLTGERDTTFVEEGPSPILAGVEPTLLPE